MVRKTTESGASEGGSNASYWKVDAETVRRIGRAARLHLTEDEVKSFAGQLEEVLRAFKKMDEVGTSGVEPSFHPQPLENDWREDSVELWEWEPLGNTKHKEGRYFKGPRIV